MPDDSLLLPAGSRLLHIGPHKTGSTAIQNAFFQVRKELDRYGAHYASTGGVRPRRRCGRWVSRGRRWAAPAPRCRPGSGWSTT